MNLLGKIFVALILVMSIFFMAMALMVYATHKNWRTEITGTGADGQPVGWKMRFEELVKTNTKLQNELFNTQREVVAERTAKAEALAKMQTALSAREQELAAAQADLKSRADALAAATATLKTQEQNVNTATAQVQKLTQDLAAQNFRADQLYSRALELGDQVMQFNVLRPRLEERNNQLAELAAKAKMLLAQVGMTLEDPLDRRPPPIEANVENINRDGLVEVAVGTDDGIRVGHELDIVRNNRFIGRIKVVNAERDRAVGTIVPGYDNLQIRRGDTATTKLNPLARRG